MPSSKRSALNMPCHANADVKKKSGSRQVTCTSAWPASISRRLMPASPFHVVHAGQSLTAPVQQIILLTLQKMTHTRSTSQTKAPHQSGILKMKQDQYRFTSDDKWHSVQALVAAPLDITQLKLCNASICHW